MSKNVLMAAITVAAFTLSSAASEAAMTNKPNTTTMSPKTVALGCSASHGDVAQTLTITNTTKATIPANTKISWVVGKAKGTQALAGALKPKGTTTVLAPPGNGGPCTASYLAK